MVGTTGIAPDSPASLFVFGTCPLALILLFQGVARREQTRWSFRNQHDDGRLYPALAHHRPLVVHLIEESPQFRFDPTQLFQMSRRQLTDHGVAACGQPNFNLPSIAAGSGTTNQATASESVDQTDRTMMFNLKVLRQLADRDEIAAG